MTNDQKEKDELSGVETTGHEWDGLKELNNPAPRWWLWVFFITVIWSLGYWVVYPAWPTLSGVGERGGTKGRWEWTQYKKLAAEQMEITERRGQLNSKIKEKTVQEIEQDHDLYAYAIAGGKTMFKENCAACHGTGAQGGNGYPNLNDDEWLWGGELENIYQTIRFGVRSGHEQAHDSQMPAFGSDGVLQKQQVNDVAAYVLALSVAGNKDSVQLARGAVIFKENCAACHGDDGKGNSEVGAPNLTDAIWLYGDDMQSVTVQINTPRHGVMPAWETRLPDETIKQLAIYVHSLGGGE